MVATSSPGGDGGVADVSLRNTRFSRNGVSVSDRDGLRVNQGGLGDLWISARAVTADDNAADGIDVDERGSGDVCASTWSAPASPATASTTAMPA